MDQRQPTMVARPGAFSISLSNPVQHHYPQQSPPQPPAQPQQVQQPRAAPMPAPQSSRTYYQQEPADPHKMEQSYSRSVTIVFWHKAAIEPIRVRWEIPTFPWFQLSQCSDFVNEFGLSPNAYVDAYNPNASTWEQELITAVRYVNGEQRLLYRSRKSLLEGMTDRDCPGLEHEIKLQMPVMQVTTTSRKRSIADTNPSEGPSHPNKQYKISHLSFPTEAGPSHVFPQNLAAPVSSSQMEQASTSAILPDSPYLAHEQQVGASEVNGDAFTTHPPIKRWPNDYAVCEIAAGLSKMDELVNQTPSLTQKAAFERVFGCRYVKSTVCRHRGVWRKADKSLRESFERMGTDERALWGEFVKRTDFRRDKSGKVQQMDADEDQPQPHHQQHHQLDYPMGAAMGMGMGLVDPGVAMGVNGGMDDGMNDGQGSLGGLGPQA